MVQSSQAPSINRDEQIRLLISSGSESRAPVPNNQIADLYQRIMQEHPDTSQVDFFRFPGLGTRAYEVFYGTKRTGLDEAYNQFGRIQDQEELIRKLRQISMLTPDAIRVRTEKAKTEIYKASFETPPDNPSAIGL